MKYLKLFVYFKAFCQFALNYRKTQIGSCHLEHYSGASGFARNGRDDALLVEEAVKACARICPRGAHDKGIRGKRLIIDAAVIGKKRVLRPGKHHVMQLGYLEVIKKHVVRFEVDKAEGDVELVYLLYYLCAVESLRFADYHTRKLLLKPEFLQQGDHVVGKQTVAAGNVHTF